MLKEVSYRETQTSVKASDEYNYTLIARMHKKLVIFAFTRGKICVY
ncbi:hypothetical protein Pint_00689 [Pistacia integerrima]|uniref:Uncharacterized protein n=1 Tax=Pistacia integerrima TaxID=434235 RepID=A0ACC0ZHV7_9ROSI|nr:hypothetical protein Pint_00689 [Pistacia integerrima]